MALDQNMLSYLSNCLDEQKKCCIIAGFVLFCLYDTFLFFFSNEKLEHIKAKQIAVPLTVLVNIVIDKRESLAIERISLSWYIEMQSES